MSKRHKEKTCVYCGQSPSTTGDHIFARSFFLKTNRGNLPKAPTCNQCNNEKSTLEHYLATVLPFGGRHQDAQANLENTSRRLEKNKKLHHEIATKMQWIPIDGASTLTLPFDGDLFHKLIVYIVKGLLWHHWKTVLEPEHDIRVKFITQHEENFFSQYIEKLATRIQENLGQGTILYEGAHSNDDPCMSIWIFSIYGGLVLTDSPITSSEESGKIVAITAKRDFLQRPNIIDMFG